MSNEIGEIDKNVDNYSIKDLMDILNIDFEDDIIYDTVMEKTNFYIQKYNDDNQDLSIFFQDIQIKLLDYINSNAITAIQEEVNGNIEKLDVDVDKTQTDNWFNNESLIQSNKVQKDKNTERKQKIDVYNNHHVPINRNQLGVNNTFNLPVAQDVLNPNLKNITTRFINLDSQFRQATSGVENDSSDYTLDLSEQLTNVLSLRLYSIQIPFSWYAIDTIYGNTCFWISIQDASSHTKIIPITIEPGNYSPTELVHQLNYGIDGSSNFSSSYFHFPNTISANYPVKYNLNNGKISMDFTGSTYTDPSHNILPSPYPISSKTTKIIFFDIYNELLCHKNCINSTAIDQTLGWIMGYKLPYISLDPSFAIISATSIVDLYGPKYLILILDDYNQNHINNGLVSITELSSNLKLPSYYNPELPYTCPNSAISNNLDTNIKLIEDDNGELLMEKLNLTYKKIPIIQPTNPRLLTQSQLYVINEIMKNNGKNTNFRTKAPTSSDTFALIPIKRSSQATTGDMYIEFSGSIQDNKRIYFGPVNINRMRITLLNDKGNLVNLNGADWSITLISENLYQY